MPIYHQYLGVGNISISIFRVGRYLEIDINQNLKILAIDMGWTEYRPPLALTSGDINAKFQLPSSNGRGIGSFQYSVWRYLKGIPSTFFHSAVYTLPHMLNLINSFVPIFTCSVPGPASAPQTSGWLPGSGFPL